MFKSKFDQQRWSLKRFIAVTGHIATTIVFVGTSLIIAWKNAQFIPWELFVAYALTSPLWYSPELVVLFMHKFVEWRTGVNKNKEDTLMEGHE
jgi:hypothetical protein